MEISWETIKKFDCNPINFNICRSPDVDLKYKKHVAELEKQSIDISTHILRSLFNNDLSVVFSRNEFPYWIEKRVQHIICWIRPNYIEEIEYVREYVDLKCKQINTENCVIFENLQKNKSVKKINHFHIFAIIPEENIDQFIKTLNEFSP